MTTLPPPLFNGAERSQDLKPAGLECSRDVSAEICQALGFDRRDAQEFSALSQLSERLEHAQTQRVEASSSRPALAGLTAAEVDARLQQAQALRQALGEF